MKYKVKDSEVVKYYAEKLMPILIHESAISSYVDSELILKKFGLPKEVSTKVRDHLVSTGVLSAVGV